MGLQFKELRDRVGLKQIDVAKKLGLKQTTVSMWETGGTLPTAKTLLIVLAVIAGVGVILALVLPYLKRRGVDVAAIIDQTKGALATVNKTLDTLRPFLPESSGVDAFDKIMNAAHIGVGQAEQLYNIGQLEPGQRKDAAPPYRGGFSPRGSFDLSARPVVL